MEIDYETSDDTDDGVLLSFSDSSDEIYYEDSQDCIMEFVIDMMNTDENSDIEDNYDGVEDDNDENNEMFEYLLAEALNENEGFADSDYDDNFDY